MKNKGSLFGKYGIIVLVILLTFVFAAPVALAKKPDGTGGGGGKGGGKHSGGGTTDTTPTEEVTLLTGSLSGNAYGVLVDADVLKLNILGLIKTSIDVTLGPLPYVVLPDQGGFLSESVLTVGLDGTVELSSNTLNARTMGGIGPHKAGSHSHASVEELNLLGGIVTADAVVAMCSSWADGTYAASDARGSLLANLYVGGISVEARPAPNTTIDLLGGITVILNEQIPGGDGIETSEMTVNAIHVKLLKSGLLGTLLGKLVSGDIIVASAHCDVDISEVVLPPPPPPPPPPPEVDDGFLTGGGILGDDSDFATFGGNAGWKGGELQTQWEYQDHGTGMNFHADTIDVFDISDSDSECVTFSGNGTVTYPTEGDTTVGYVIDACDRGEPGDNDAFELTLDEDGHGASYSSFDRFDTATIAKGGNLQLHVK